MSETRRFERFVGIDWSGARRRYHRGIAISVADAGDRPPRLVTPPRRSGWARREILDWIADLAGGPASLVGIDCAFSLPWDVAGGYLHPQASARDLWRLVDRVCVDDHDLFGGTFAGIAPYTLDYWHSGPRPEGYRESVRLTEDACRLAGLGSPESPFKLIGAKQVGKGALAGMRLLHRLRQQCGGAVEIWPFDDESTASLTIVEIYPRLFLRLAGMGNRKLRTAEDVDVTLGRLGSLPTGLTGPMVDHDTDALITAAGLRYVHGDSSAWKVSGAEAPRIRQEGWIFGVPMPTLV